MEEEPAKKKLKLDADHEKFQDIIHQIQTSANNLNIILSDEFIKPIPVIEMYVASVKNSKDISKAIRVLNEKVPLNELNHLKRVRNNLILLCPSNKIKEITVQEFIQAKVPELNDAFECFKKVPVPQFGPKLKCQHIEINKMWSCNFHPDAYLEKLNSDKFFSSHELKLHRLYMSMAFEAALWHFKEIETSKVNKIFYQKNVCIVVDPHINSVVAVALDNSDSHPVQHSAMVAIDNVSKTQYGGSWNCKAVQSLDCSLEGIDKDLLEYLKKQFPNINFGAKQFKTKEDLQLDEKSNSDGPYLCTNYYVYMLREPCLMCGMGLVHARVKRLFYCFDSPTFGALKSKTKLHTVSSLNHRYEVFTGFV